MMQSIHRWIGVAMLALAPLAAAQQVAYEKYTLPNGMTVILHEDHRLPVATINIWYHVGAKDELPGRSGFAHLFEHLMFMGTERVPGNQFDLIMETGGGSNNASTSLDRTNYFSEGPASLLPTLLWLDADRLEDLARTMSQEKLDRQRDIVRNEIRQNVENTPYGRAEEEIYRIMYPEGHPYRDSVYGTHEDLEAATVWNVKDFFATYYTPGNASLVVAGDFDPAKIRPLVDSLFGTLAGAPAADHIAAAPVRLAEVVRTTMVDRVQLPLVRMTWHSPAYYKPGDAEMDLLAAVLSSGKGSRLYKRLVLEEKTAVDVRAYQASAGLGSLFHIDVFARPEADLGAVERAVDEEVARLLESGPDAKELDERKAEVELAKLAQLQRLGAVADKLNEYQFYFGEPDSFRRDLDRYRNATAETVQRFGRGVLLPGARSIIRVVPEEPERASNPRDERPSDLPPQDFAPQAPETFTLGNGIDVMLWNRPDLPLVAAWAVFTPGGPLAPAAVAGLPTLTGDMLDEGAGELDAVAFANALQGLGAGMSVDVSQEAATVSLLTLRRNAEAALGLFADALRRPRLTEPDWQRVKSLHLEALAQQEEEPTVVAARVGLRALFGEEHPYGRPTDGTPATVAPLGLEDVKAEYSGLFRPEHATILIAGDITPEDARALLERTLGNWDPPAVGSGGAPAVPAAAAAEDEFRVLIVDRPDAVQTVIRFMALGPAYTDEDRVAYRLLNTLLGGSFTSRLNQNLRERHGYTYGANSRFAMGPSTGYFVAASSVRTDVTGESVAEFLREFQRLEGGDISPEEAGKARESLRTDTIQSLAGLNGLLAAAAERLVNRVPFSSIGLDLETMRDADAERLNALGARVVPRRRGVLVLVGDRARIMEEIEGLNLPEPRMVDVHGNPAE